MATLEDAMTRLQSVHAVVERMAVEVKSGKPIGSMAQQMKRVATPLQGQLKAQFGLISDLVAGLLLAAGRGGPDKIRLRTFREFVAQIRTQLEIAVTQTKEKHAVREAEAGGKRHEANGGRSD